MLRLFKTTCDTDWKGRPSHRLEQLGVGTHEELVQLMGADVEDIQACDLLADKESAQEIGEEPPTVWQNSNRWEMYRENPKERQAGPHTYPMSMRVLCYSDEGAHTSVVYHILDLE